MSEIGPPRGVRPPPPVPRLDDPPVSPPPPPARHGCLTAFMIVCGIILLLPGLCAVIFGIGTFANSTMEPVVAALFGLGLFVGFLGIVLIWAAIRGLRS